jgi:transposase InsO family protein
LRTVRYYRRLGVQFERVLTDNGACYRSRSFRRLVRRLGMRHLRTRLYTPRTNGKAERLVQTSLYEWAYAPTQLRTASPRAAGLASSLQMASTTCQSWLQATHHPNPTEQRGGFTQLVAGSQVTNAACDPD